MSAAVLDTLRQERDQARDAAIALAEQDDFDPSSDAYVQLESRATSLDSQITHLASLFDARQAADALDGKMSKATRQHEERSSSHEGAEAARADWGSLFTRSESWTDYRGRGQSARFELDSGLLQTRALPTGISDLVAAGMKGNVTSVDITAPTPPTPLVDNVNNVQVSGNAIEYVAFSKKAGSAATVAEKAAKPSVEFGPTVTPDTLELIACYTQLTRQLMEDAPAVTSLINGELRREIAREQEEHAAAAIAAATLPTAEGDDLLSAIRVGMATVQVAGFTPSAVLLAPEDWAELDVAIFGSNANGPLVQQSFWGLRPIPVPGQTAGTAIVGDLSQGVTRFFRSDISIYVTDSHADTFLSNVFTLLAEVRSKTAVVRPQALVEVSAAA